MRRFCGDAPRSFERAGAHKMHARPLAASPTMTLRRPKNAAQNAKDACRCVALARTPLASVSGAQQKKSKKTSQSTRSAFANDVVLSIKTPTEDRLSGVPLAFALDLQPAKNFQCDDSLSLLVGSKGIRKRDTR